MNDALTVVLYVVAGLCALGLVAVILYFVFTLYGAMWRGWCRRAEQHRESLP